MCGDSLPSCSITSHLLMQPETCITPELNNIFLSIHDRKICVLREIALLIKNTTTKPEYCSERKGHGLRCTQKTTFLQTTVWGYLLEQRHNEQRLPAAQACVCSQVDNLLGKIVFKAELDLNRNCRARHTLNFGRSWSLVRALGQFRLHTLPSLWILPTITDVSSQLTPQTCTISQMVLVTLKPSKGTLAHNCFCTRCWGEQRKSQPKLPQIGNILCILTRRGWRWKSCCAAVGNAAENRDAWCRTAQVSRRCLQGCVTSGARCLARVTGPFSLLGQFWFSGEAGKQAAATPGDSCTRTLTPEPLCCRPSRVRYRQLTLAVWGTTSGGRSCVWVRSCVSCQPPRNALWRDFGWRGGKEGEGVWDHTLEIPSLPRAHAFSFQSPWEPGETKGITAGSQVLVCSSCIQDFAWPVSLSVRLITGISKLLKC